MGVPSFYKWLVDKYPKVVVDAVEEDEDVRGRGGRNPNGLEFDNLYLDMNGIIHPCFHPDDPNISPPTTFDQVFDSVFEYIDRLFWIVRPRKLLYLAIDGVAPRAKMNQQRSRRFRNAKDDGVAEKEEERLRKEYERKGKFLLAKEQSQVSDSNVITPGTEFMDHLSKALQVYICTRLKDCPAWKNIQVILSDANVPGEGEHKIMSFIRSQRNLPGYDVNTRHCLYGLDADLIMLALATHEIHFSILREVIFKVEEQKPEVASALTSSIRNTECSSTKSRGWFKPLNIAPRKKPYQFLHVWILREYLELDLQINDPPKHFLFDIERIVDDFIFMCFLVGNDFLPHMPTLDIFEGAIDLLMHVYTKELKNMGGYIVDIQRAGDPHTSFIKLKRVEKFILAVGSFEEKIFKKRTEIRDGRLRRILSELQEARDEEVDDELVGPNTEAENSAFGPRRRASTSVSVVVNPPLAMPQMDDPSLEYAQRLENTREMKVELRNCLKQKSDSFRNASFDDKIKLDSAGFKERYYRLKFSAQDLQSVEIIRKEIVQKYVEGLCWVLLYYFSGVPSWTWYYPYYYGPFASDLKGASQVRVKFQKNVPFLPFDQLLAVLPPRSVKALPESYGELMTNATSEIIAFYPDDFEVDMDGKRFLWQGVCKLPFIDESRLLKATIKLKEKLKICDMERNKHGDDQLFFHVSNQFGSQLASLWQSQVSKLQRHQTIEIENLRPDYGIGGSFRQCPVDILSPQDKAEDEILRVHFNLPEKTCTNIPRLLEGVEPPEKTINESDITETTLWHEHYGSRPPTRLPSQVQHQRPLINRDRFGATDSSSSVIHTNAGSGWTRGGGRGSTLSCERNSSGYSTERFVSDDRDWRAVSSVHRSNRGIQQLRTSQGGISRSYGRGRGRGDHYNFWPHTNVAGHDGRNAQCLSNSSTYNNPPHYTNRNARTTVEGNGQIAPNSSNVYRAPSHFTSSSSSAYRAPSQFTSNSSNVHRAPSQFTSSSSSAYRAPSQFTSNSSNVHRAPSSRGRGSNLG